MASRLLAAAVAVALLAPTGPVRAQVEDSQAGPALPLDGADAGAFRRRGDQYRDAGDYDRAIADYGEALTRAPDDVEALRGRAETLDILRRPREAVADYSRLLANAPDDGFAHANRAVLLSVLQSAPGPGFRSRADYDLALSDFDAAFRLLPAENEGILRYARGDLLAQHGDAAPALADFEAAAKVAPDNMKFLYRLSHARRDAGDAAGAKAALEAAAKLPYDRTVSDDVEAELSALRPPTAPPPPPPAIDGLVIVEARTAIGGDGELKIRMRFDDDSAKKIAAFTTDNVGRHLAFIADGETIASAALAEPITGGAVELSTLEGEHDVEQRAERLVKAKTLTLRVVR